MVTLADKRAYIDDDFKQKFERFEEIPTDLAGLKTYINELETAVFDWIDRWDHKTQGRYAMEVCNDWMWSIQKRVGDILRDLEETL